MTFRSNFLRLLLPIISGFAACGLICADTVTEEELKMALAYNFARYTEWPEAAPTDTFRFCVINDDRLARTFEQLTKRRIGEKAITVTAVEYGDDMRSCQVLMIGGRDRRAMTLALKAVKEHPVLTIGQLPDFIDSGGMIQLYQERDKLRFNINPYEARRAGLRISARLLQLATIVGE